MSGNLNLIYRCWVAMELPCEIYAAKMPPEFGLFYEYGKDTHAGFGKGLLPGIEGCIESDGIYTE
jgi:hypothetical protein